MNLKFRLNLIISLLLLAIISLGVISIIHDARKNVQAEIASTAVLALHMLDAELLLYGSGKSVFNHSGLTDDSVFRLKKLQNVRHLKIDFYDAEGRLRDSNHRHSNDDDDELPPQWFYNIMDSVSSEMPKTTRQVLKGNNLVGELVVTPDPSNEIAEVWEEAKSMFSLLGIFFVIANLLIYLAVSRALRPIDDIVHALTELEQGKLSSRLPKFTLPELTSISDKFNVMAAALQDSTESNHHLTQQMIKLQEDERKNLAQELHDEIGQHLTAIHVDASAILKAKTIDMATESAKAIDVVARQMMDIIHTILHRLRPSGLDELGIELALSELVSGWQQRQKQTKVNMTVKGNFSGKNEVILLTIYRIVQECLTNIARHAEATTVNIVLEQKQQMIHLAITDDGKGFETGIKPQGFGLAGMRERVDGLSGTLTIESEVGQGASITITLPCQLNGD